MTQERLHDLYYCFIPEKTVLFNPLSFQNPKHLALAWSWIMLDTYFSNYIPQSQQCTTINCKNKEAIDILLIDHPHYYLSSQCLPLTSSTKRSYPPNKQKAILIYTKQRVNLCHNHTAVVATLS